MSLIRVMLGVVGLILAIYGIVIFATAHFVAGAACVVLGVIVLWASQSVTNDTRP